MSNPALVSIDPGANGCWGMFRYRQLIACGRWPCLDFDGHAEAVIEDQVIIVRFTKQPAAIIKLAQRAGAAAAAFGWPEDQTRVTWVKPRSWKGGTKKPTSAKAWASYPIHRLVVQALSSAELAIYTVQLASFAPGERHDLADGVGIGLWHLGRLGSTATEAA